MKNEKIEMSLEQKERMSSMLQSQGLSQKEIDVILKGEYESYDSEADLESVFGGLRKHGDVLEKLSDGYTINELQKEGISPKKIEAFTQMLSQKNLTVENAKAIYQYSVDSDMILDVKRGKSKAIIQDKIIPNLEKALKFRGVQQEIIEKIKQFVKDSDYEETPLHNNYDKTNKYMEKIGLPQNSRVSVLSAMQSMDRCTHIEETISSLQEGLGSTNLPKSMKLYRAVKSSYLEKGLKEGENLSNLVGKSISNKGQTSTSPLYDSSFASLDEYDTVFEIYVPQGSRGAYIAELSAYDKTEQEVLLNPNDLYITGIQIDVIDKNGRTKNVLQALCLSKDIECYKGINKQQETDLLAKQNRFLRFFNQLKSRFTRQNQHDNQHSEQQVQQNNTQSYEKKSWELESEKQGDFQQMQQGQFQQPISQQHLQDMGEIEK